MRVCNRCGIEKPEEEYYQRKDKKINKICKDCSRKQNNFHNKTHKENRKLYEQEHKSEISEYQKNYRRTHKTEKAAGDALYRQTHKTEIAKRKRIYQQEHKEQLAEYFRTYQQQNKTELAEYQKNYRLLCKAHLDEYFQLYYESHRERILERSSLYYKTPRGKQSAKLNGNRRRARKQNAFVEDINEQEIFERDSWTCGICGKKVSPKYKWPHPESASLDHIIPFAKNGSHEKKNVQCSHLRCNLKKHIKAVGCQLRVFG